MIKKLKSFSTLFLLSTLFVVGASNVDAEEVEKKVSKFDKQLDIKVASVSINNKDSKKGDASKVEFEVIISHPSYEVLSLDAEKSKVNGIFVYNDGPKNILQEAKVRRKIEEEKEKQLQEENKQRGIFTLSGCFAGEACEEESLESSTYDGNLYINYKYNKLGLESVRNLWVKADLYVQAAAKEQEEGKTLVKEAVISNTKPSGVSNDDISFIIISNGSYKASGEGNSYGFSVTEFDKYLKEMKIVNLIDNEVLATIENIDNSFYIDEKFLGRPINLAITYYELEEMHVELSQYLVSK